MKIEYWADFTCPYSYIGSSNLKQALKNLNMDADLFMHSYELNPDMKGTTWESTKQQLMEKDGMTSQEADAQIEAVNAYGRASGLPIHFADDHFCNTFDAHRLTDYAQSIDPKLANRLVSALFHAVFAEGLVLADHAVLKQIAKEQGLDEQAVAALLDSDDFASQVRQEEARAEEIGVESIPYFIVDGTVVDSSHPVADFEAILKKAAGKD